MKRIKLSSLCVIQSGGTPARTDSSFWSGGTIPWIKISDFNGKFISAANESITEKGLSHSSAKIFPKGSILYTIFATLGETAILNIEACTNQAIAGLMPDTSRLEPEYLYYFLKSLKKYVNSIGRGVAQNNINMSILKDIEIPLPALSRQAEIISVLNKVEAIINRHTVILSRLDELVKSQFIHLTHLTRNAA